MPLRPGLRPGRTAFCAALALALGGCAGGKRTPLPPVGPPLAPGEAARLLLRHAPELRYDARDRSFATDVRALATRAVLRDDRGRTVVRAPSVDTLGVARPTRPAAGRGSAARKARLDAPSSGLPERGDVAYGHAVQDRAGRVWLQYWLFSTDNLQDRGVVRTGRHEGDWELAQVGLDAARGPATLTLARHSWAEGCASSAERPVVYVANGSHASYAQRGEHGRPWPEPDDEARGDGRRAVPRVIPISDAAPSWVRWPGRWGGSRRAWWNPLESDSPVGPRFQEARQWSDPAGFHAGARACGSGAPQPPGLIGVYVALPLLVLLFALRRRRQRQTP